MKLVGQVRAVERAMGNSNGDATRGVQEKRTFKLDVKPASRADAYYGYGSMQFILHGRELEESGLDLSTKVELYLVPEGTEAPPIAEVESVRRELYDREQEVAKLQKRIESLEEQARRTSRSDFDRSERAKALQQENVRLTVQLMTLQGATGVAAGDSVLLEGGAQPE